MVLVTFPCYCNKFVQSILFVCYFHASVFCFQSGVPGFVLDMRKACVGYPQYKAENDKSSEQQELGYKGDSGESSTQPGMLSPMS